jgi:hypothetical protein
MKGIGFVVLFWGVVASLALAQDKPCYPTRHIELPVITELTYHQARERLLAAGWQPKQTKSYNLADSDPDLIGNGLMFWNRGYVEVEACSGTGLGACIFLFTDVYGNLLRVTTLGQEIPEENAFAKVVGFHFVCEE